MSDAGTAMLSSVAVGDEMAPLSRTVTQDQISAYADASGDHNPIHVDPDFARSVGLPGTIAHGLLDMAILTEAVARWAGGYEQVASVACRFSKPLLPGETVTCTGRVVQIDDAEGTATLDVEAVSSSGERVLTNGRATVRLPRERG
ncbi:MAG: MaoC family dehydratase N-terminal domain-containing protein [Candidatus Dormibacteraeota bacterium]|uniref:Acyl dehydratase n=1 Tax=Candidatus Aeolococcus gillhamiae TaxID=3127015 RepID=A0A2W5ZLG5_9BACT|nr:MaoC family dehydratase N-terminal domain-containing protein [Candidatus Dormibacteraeota bacterium]PZR83895.1 MAG: acyl dehydratase [Candidatus Dormibacter sp. RRmetagenome_bin12]